MKNLTRLALCGVLLSVTLLSSCKKGEDDPALSLRSRKARIAGEWKVTQMDYYEMSQSNGTTETSTMTYDGTTETTVNTFSTMGETSTETETIIYTEKYTFKKDGTYAYARTYDSGFALNTEGTWVFLAKSKENELKNREAILLSKTKYTSQNSTVDYTGVSGDQIITIRQLKNKEMVWEDSFSTSSGSNLDSGTQKTTLTQD
ncbi:MAG: hypothetical protein ACO1O6_08320 [Bacteroidota bacterium]